MEALGDEFWWELTRRFCFGPSPEACPPKAQIAALDRFQPPNGSDKDSLKWRPKRDGISGCFSRKINRSENSCKMLGGVLGDEFPSSLLRISVGIN